jgi:hypothetical protein
MRNAAQIAFLVLRVYPDRTNKNLILNLRSSSEKFSGFAMRTESYWNFFRLFVLPIIWLRKEKSCQARKHFSLDLFRGRVWREENSSQS